MNKKLYMGKIRTYMSILYIFQQGQKKYFKNMLTSYIHGSILKMLLREQGTHIVFPLLG